MNMRDRMRRGWCPSSTISRREVLEAGLLAAAAAALPPGAAAMGNSASTVGPVMEKLSSYMSEASSRALPDDVLEQTKLHVLDTIAAMISGSELPPGQSALRFAQDYGGKAVSTVVASKLIIGPIEAAMTNGMLAHADETDDSHSASQSHPGCAVVPAALASGERFAINGTHFLRAVALGYDVGPRVTVTLGGQRFEADSHWSTHSISPLFGAASAAGCAAGLNAQQMRLLLGYTAHLSSGLGAWNRDTQHVQKAFHFGGMTARNGVTAALLVESGWSGVDDIFSGKDSFFAAYNPQANPAGLIDELGERYEVMRTNIKKWPVGSPIQAALDAIVLLRRERAFTAGDVQKVTVRLAEDEAAIVDNRDIPDICLQHMVAVLLLDGTVSFASAHNSERLKDPVTLRERSKVQLIPDEDLERLMPLRVAVVDVLLADGTRMSRRVDDVRGTPKNPMPRSEVVAKATDLITPVIGATQTGKLVSSVLHLEELSDVRNLRPLLQRP